MFGQGEVQRALVVQDAYLAAVAEHLAECWRLRCSDRAQGERRFLQRPFFCGGPEGSQGHTAGGKPGRIPALHAVR